MKQGFQRFPQLSHRSTDKSEAQQTWKDLFKQAINLHQRAVAGDKQASKRAYELLVEIRGMSSGDNTVEAYLGSAMILQGRDEKNPEEKLKKVYAGLKILDKAVSRDANNIELRILRAYVCVNLPEDIFHRRTTAVGDFTYLLSRYEKTPSIFTADFYQQIRRDLAAVQSKSK